MCFLIFHKWSKWSKVSDSTTQFRKLQFSKCLRCNAVRQRVVILKDCNHSTAGAKEMNALTGQEEIKP